MNPLVSLAWLIFDDPGPILRLRARHVDVALARTDEPRRIYDAIVDGPARIVVSFADATYFATWANAETGEDCARVEALDVHTTSAPDLGPVWGLHAEAARKVDRDAHRDALITMTSMPHERIATHLRDGTIDTCVVLPDAARPAAYFLARYAYELRGMLVGIAQPCRAEA